MNTASRFFGKLILLTGFLCIIYIFSADFRDFLRVHKDNNNFQKIYLTSPLTPNGIETLKHKEHPNHAVCSVKQKNLVFVKTHKTGTSTTVNILYNFGIVNELNYALYAYTHQLYKINPERLMKLLPNETYNIMCQHMVFNKATTELVMPPDSYYFTLIREPIHAFVSYFIFYGIDKRYSKHDEMTLDTSINKFLDDISKSSDSKELFFISNNINSMSYDLGMSNGVKSFFNKADIDAYVHLLDERFDMMLILEQLDESLLLLQQDLCWNTSDIFYLNRMKSKSQRSHEELKPSTLDRLKKMLVPDYTLYNTFKDNLDRRLSNTYSNFTSLLQNFKESRAKFESDCVDTESWAKGRYGSVQHPLRLKGQSSLQCNILSDPDVELTQLVSYLQDPNYSERSLKSMVIKYKDLETFPRQWKLLSKS